MTSYTSSLTGNSDKVTAGYADNTKEGDQLAVLQ